MIKVFIFIFFTITLAYTEPYPTIFSKMGTPLYKANKIFEKYNYLTNIKLYSEQYQKAMQPVLEYGYELDKINNPPKKEVLNYLKKLRELQKKHDYIIYNFSLLLLESINENDYEKFSHIANIKIDSIFTFNNSAQIISYYKQNLNRGKIKNIDILIENNKIKHNKNEDTTKHTKPLYDIYWVSSIGGNTGYKSGIYGANRDNLKFPTKIISLDTRLNPCTVDKQGNIYWCDVTDKAIYKADPDGTNIRVIISDLNHPKGIAIDNKRQRVYWADWLLGENKGIVNSADLSGNDKKIILADELKSGGHLFYDALYHRLYIADLSGRKVIRVDLNTKDITRVAFAGQVSDIVVDYVNNRVIWADVLKDSISSANFDGSDKRVLIKFISQFANPDALTIDTVNNHLIYSINSSTTSKTRIEISDLDGSNRQLVNRSVEPSVESLFSVF